MKSLRKEDVMFDEESFKEINSEEEANSYMRYYTKNVVRFRTELQMLGWPISDIEMIINLLWMRVIRGCIKFGVPFTELGKEQAKRLNIK